jgi:hypothetical protein
MKMKIPDSVFALYNEIEWTSYDMYESPFSLIMMAQAPNMKSQSPTKIPSLNQL